MSKRIKISSIEQEQRELVPIVAASDEWHTVEERPATEQPRRLAVFGSRSIQDCRAEIVITEILTEYATIHTVVTTQEPRGVCEIAQAIAKKRSLILELHFLDFKYLRGAFEHRSKQVINGSDFVLLVHDGVSQGTKNELDLTRKSTKPYRYIVMQPSSVHADRNVGENLLK